MQPAVQRDSQTVRAVTLPNSARLGDTSISANCDISNMTTNAAVSDIHR